MSWSIDTAEAMFVYFSFVAFTEQIWNIELLKITGLVGISKVSSKSIDAQCTQQEASNWESKPDLLNKMHVIDNNFGVFTMNLWPINVETHLVQLHTQNIF